MSETPILEVQNLRVSIGRPGASVHAVRGATLTVRPGARLGIVGESGSGKSTLGLAVLRLLPPAARIEAGAIRYGGRDLVTLPEREMRRVRGSQISMVFQNAAASLNPLISVGQQIADVYCHHTGASRAAGWEKAVAMLRAMGIPQPERRARAYPHEYSGGMAQRAVVAMALVCSPRLLIADEPTTGLDPTIQAQVLDLIGEQVAASGAALILISHDISVIREMCSDLVIMYAGEVMEAGPAERVFGQPAHPYTRALLQSFEIGPGGKVFYIPGVVPDLRQELPGCPFASRCPMAQEPCHTERPPVRQIGPGHTSACHYS